MPDPLVVLLIGIRKAHGLSQKAVEVGMHLPEGTIRHIEIGRRKLPDFQNGLIVWIRNFQACVHASELERKQILDLLSKEILKQFGDLLDDLSRT
jgi:hypothetical protein